MKNLSRALCPFLLLCLPFFAQAQRGQFMKNINAADQEEIIERLSVFLAVNHIDSVRAKAAGDSLRARFARGEYRKASENVADFVSKVDVEVRQVLKDGLTGLDMIARNPNPYAQDDYFHSFELCRCYKEGIKTGLKHRKQSRANREALTTAYKASHQGKEVPYLESGSFRRDKTMGDTLMTRGLLVYSNRKYRKHQKLIDTKIHEAEIARRNFGHNQIKIMENGAAYWKIGFWATPATTRYDDKFMAATALANDGNSLVLDFRGTAWGDPAALPHFMAAFLPPGKKKVLGRIAGKTVSKPLEVTKRMLKESPKFSGSVPIYILTDGRTAGVSEWAAQLLRQYRGAKIIGEKTAGQSFFPMYELFWVEFLLSAAVNEARGIQMEKTLWADTGLVPDVETPAGDALKTALLMIDGFSERKTAVALGLESYKELFANRQKTLAWPQPDSSALLSYFGGYSPGKTLLWENGALCLKNAEGQRQYFKNFGAGLFMAEGVFEDDKIVPQRGSNQNLTQNEFTRLPIKPLYLSFPEGENPDMTVIYTNGRHFIFKREGKTDSGETEEEANKAEQNAYDPFADTVKNGVWVRSVQENYPGEMENTEAAPFEFTDMEGEYLSSGNFTGNKAVVLNFWFSACAPCVAEMPAFNALKEKYADQEVSFIGINRYDDSERILKFLKKHPFNFHLIANDEDQKTAVEKSLADYKAVVFPTTVLIGKDGKIKFARAGYLPEYSGMLDRAIKKELGL